MKSIIGILIIVNMSIFVAGCSDVKSPKEKVRFFDKAVVYYNPNEAPWGLLKVINVPVEEFLRHKDHLSEIILTDKDSLQYISEIIHKARLDSLSNKHADTSIAVLLFSNEKIDTLATDAFPQYPIQYNNSVFRDSMLVYYIIDIIRSRNIIWNDAAKEFYYNGAYNPLPRSTININHNSGITIASRIDDKLRPTR